jgi:hypothetical protein
MSNLDWPPHFDRTSPANRSKNRNYEVTLSKAFRDLERTLDRLGVDDYRYGFDARQRQRDGRPYARANPDDPGFVLRWSMEGQQFAVACDRYSRLRDNVRTVGLYIEEKRKMESRPVTTGESEFANARLPPGDEEDAVVATASAEPPHEVLGVAPDAPDGVVRAAARELKKQHHPDNGGSTAEFQRVVEAEEAMVDG